MGHYDCKECHAAVHEEHADNCSKKRDWTSQWDGCDVCELCGNLVTGGRTFARMSLAVTTLYTFGALTSSERDKARARITKIAAKEKQNELA